MSSDCAEVYRLSSPSFLAPAISFCRRSGPAYKPTSAAVAFGLTCPRTDAGRTAPATNRLARRLNPNDFMRRVLFRSMAGSSVGFLLDLLTFEEEIRPKFLPAVGLVEGDHRVDHGRRESTPPRMPHLSSAGRPLGTFLRKIRADALAPARVLPPHTRRCSDACAAFRSCTR